MNLKRAEIKLYFRYLFAVFCGSIFLLLLLPQSVFAQTNPNCNSVYGATCPSSQLFVEKKVQNPKTGELVNVISSNTVTFGPSDEVNFRIEVKNTGSSLVNGVFVQDRLPNIKFISSNPGASFDAANNILSWTLDNLGAGESRFIQVKGQIRPQNELNFDIACVTNFAQAQKDAQTASANAVFCIQARALKGAPQVTETPKTGMPAVLWVLSALFIPLGFKLRKFAFSDVAIDNSLKDQANYIYQMRKISKEGGERNEY